ncbi:hypothetical protein K461DRAFT_313497 [Myriangium duriaei CBS 260.36]|uniref:Uncharacterized protein n=1 Tax=Myriangium duriaei CBS 260.36 TaxID=1168546 RepID=A0A9P4J3B5_9PEZI|nr:hypothetical protein K461DRAFT_313497 [Myriangium duriaei CBS 260.36]
MDFQPERRGSDEWLQHDQTDSGRFLLANSLVHEGSTWGFVVVRTSRYGSEWDETWSGALSKLHKYMEFGVAKERLLAASLGRPAIDDRAEQLVVAKFKLAILEDEQLAGINDEQAREHVANWRQNDSQKEFLHYAEAFLVIDQEVMETLATAPTPNMDADSEMDSEESLMDITVKVVDPDYGARDQDSDSGSEHFNQHYRGWMKAEAKELSTLFERLNLDHMEQVCPEAEYGDQIPVFDGGDGRFIDPPGCTRERPREMTLEEWTAQLGSDGDVDDDEVEDENEGSDEAED